MEHKRVSFEVAKAIKEAGYSQYFEGYEEYGYFMNGKHPQIYNHDENDCPMYYKLLCVAPTYLDVWLWLWRKKEICILLNNGAVVSMQGADLIWRIVYQNNHSDPEEAIIAAIEYLIENNLIK